MFTKKIRLSIFIFLAGLLVFTSCDNDSDAIIGLQDFSLSQSDILLGIGEVQSIVATATPENSNEGLTWTSGDESVAQIQYNASGKVAGVKGIALGQTVLTAKSADGAVTRTVDVQVLIKVESIALEEEPMDDDSQTRYIVIFTPENATIQDVVWESDNPSVISVSDGVVTAVSAGSAVITATTVQGGKTASVSLVASGDPAVLGLLYCTASGSGGYNSDEVTTTGADTNINYSGSAPAGNYEYYESEKIIVQPEGSFDLTVTNSNGWSRSMVWIDWNGDKDFEDDGEFIGPLSDQEYYSGDGPISYTISINVPIDAQQGINRMRILTGDAWTYNDAGIPASPCGELINSTVKDFNIEIGGVSYCTASGTGAYHSDAVVTSGGDTNINYSGTAMTGNYEFYTAELVSVQAGGSFDLTVTNSNGWSRSIVWIDWNADGDFDDTNELIGPMSDQEYYSGDGPISYTISIDVPVDASSGTSRIRILTGDAWTYNDAGIPSSPCGELVNSYVKDFAIKIL